MPFVAAVRPGSKRHAMPFVEGNSDVRSLARREVPEIRRLSGGDTNRLVGTAVPPAARLVLRKLASDVTLHPDAAHHRRMLEAVGAGALGEQC
jgi:hypothetical protein